MADAFDTVLVSADADFFDVLAAALGELGARVIAFSDADTALIAVEEHLDDDAIVVIDVYPAHAERIAARIRSLPHCFLLLSVTPNALRPLVGGDRVFVLSKPFEFSELAHAVKRCRGAVRPT